MTKAFILDKIAKGNCTIEQITGWVTAMPGSPINRKPSEYRKGDVLMHPVFQHPYVLLKKKGDMWICAMITSEPECTEILEQCKSRFFGAGFFTRVLLTVKEPVGNFMNPFENHKQLISITRKLEQIFTT